MDAIIIRPATEADINAIGKLWEKLAGYHSSLDPRLPKPAHHGATLYAQRIHDQLDDAYSQVLVADYNGTLIGYVVGFIADYMPDVFLAESHGFLADIFVESDYRGAGIGKQLVENLRHWFKTRGITTMEWYVASENLPAYAFWQSLGGKNFIIRMRIEL